MVVLSFWPPTKQEQERSIVQGVRGGFNYKALGATEAGKDSVSAASFKNVWVVDHKRVQVGKGKDAYRTVRSLLQTWGHFQLGWASVPPATRVLPGAPVCVSAKSLFLWTANPLQIVYAKDTTIQLADGKGRQGTADMFTFAHGCLKGHLLAGEERFSVSHNHLDDSVWYEVLTFSRPAHPLALLTYPMVRLYQNKFAVDSAAAVQRAVMPPPPTLPLPASPKGRP